MNEYLKVKPIIIYPPCIKKGEKQDCLNCKIKCQTPRSFCLKPYAGHKKGCPNYGKKKHCPPNVPMFDQVFDISKDIYIIYSIFDLEEHVNKMKEKHPDWSYRRLSNLLYWQGTVRKDLKDKIKEFLKEYEPLGYSVTLLPEAMGVNVTETLKQVNISLEWPPKKYVYKVAFAGIVKDKEWVV